MLMQIRIRNTVKTLAIETNFITPSYVKRCFISLLASFGQTKNRIYTDIFVFINLDYFSGLTGTSFIKFNQIHNKIWCSKNWKRFWQNDDRDPSGLY